MKNINIFCYKTNVCDLGNATHPERITKSIRPIKLLHYRKI